MCFYDWTMKLETGLLDSIILIVEIVSKKILDVRFVMLPKVIKSLDVEDASKLSWLTAGRFRPAQGTALQLEGVTCSYCTLPISLFAIQLVSWADGESESR